MGTPLTGGSSRHGLTVVAYDANALAASPISQQLAAPALNELLDACLHDLLASVIQLSGVSFTVFSPSRNGDDGLLQTLPAGVNLISGEQQLDQSARDRFIFNESRARGVARTVIVAGDTLALPAATAGTAFGVLESADLVVGATRAGERYLVGAGDQPAITAIVEAGIALPSLWELATERQLVTRRMEPRSRLTDVASLDDLRTVPGLGPRVLDWLASF